MRDEKKISNPRSPAPTPTRQSRKFPEKCSPSTTNLKPSRSRTYSSSITSPISPPNISPPWTPHALPPEIIGEFQSPTGKFHRGRSPACKRRLNGTASASGSPAGGDIAAACAPLSRELMRLTRRTATEFQPQHSLFAAQQFRERRRLPPPRNFPSAAASHWKCLPNPVSATRGSTLPGVPPGKTLPPRPPPPIRHPLSNPPPIRKPKPPTKHPHGAQDQAEEKNRATPAARRAYPPRIKRTQIKPPAPTSGTRPQTPPPLTRRNSPISRKNRLHR